MFLNFLKCFLAIGGIFIILRIVGRYRIARGIAKMSLSFTVMYACLEWSIRSIGGNQTIYEIVWKIALPWVLTLFVTYLILRYELAED